LRNQWPSLRDESKEFWNTHGGLFLFLLALTLVCSSGGGGGDNNGYSGGLSLEH
jgi:hypothetical protein